MQGRKRRRSLGTRPWSGGATSLRPAGRTGRGQAAHSSSRAARAVVGLLTAVLVAVSWTTTSRAAGGSPGTGTGGVGTGQSGATITVNGQPLKSGSTTLLTGCTMEVAVSGITGSPAVAILVEAMMPTGTGTVLSVEEPFSSGSLTTGPRNLATVLGDGGFSKKANGYHLRVSVTVGDAKPASAPYWLACGAVQHSSHSVQVSLSVVWKGRNGQTTATPPGGLPRNFVLTGVSGQGSGRCRYGKSGALSCQYVVTTEEGSGDEGEGPPSGVRVSGLGTYVVEETGLPRGWAPDLSTVGQFAADPSLLQWTGPPEDEDEAVSAHVLVPMAGGPPVSGHVIVNVQQP